MSPRQQPSSRKAPGRGGSGKGGTSKGSGRGTSGRSNRSQHANEESQRRANRAANAPKYKSAQPPKRRPLDKGEQVDPAMRAGYRSKGRSTSELGGDQVEGRRAVRELLIAGRRGVREILVSVEVDAADILDEIIELADEAHIPIRQIGRSRLDSIAKTDAPQGIIARAEPLKPVDLEDLCGASKPSQPFLLVLDGVTDPHNLGALLRSAECAGVTGVVLPRHRAVHVTATVTKSAAGAVEYLPFAVVGGIPSAISQMGDLGIATVGLDMTGERTLWDLGGLDAPVALVLGAEGKGLSRLVRKRCETISRIPLNGRTESLNVSVAGALACYEVARARH